MNGACEVHCDPRARSGMKGPFLVLANRLPSKSSILDSVQGYAQSDSGADGDDDDNISKPLAAMKRLRPETVSLS